MKLLLDIQNIKFIPNSHILKTDERVKHTGINNKIN